MDSVGKTLCAALLILACACQSSFAADSRTIKVSCTIPAIPGVNCDLVEQQKPAQQTAYVQPKEQLDEPDSRQEEQQGESKHEESIETDEEDQTVLVKTFYDR